MEMKMTRSRNESNDSRPAPPPYIGHVIPRVKPIRKDANNVVGEKNSRPPSKRYDTFGENALETIYDQFKFLDESDEPSTSSQTPTSVNSTRPIMAVANKKISSNDQKPRMIFYCVLPTIQLLAAVAILASSFIAGSPTETNPESTENSNLATEAVHTLAFQNALSTILPSFFQILSAIFGFWPIIASKHRQTWQILHIFFNSLIIVLWFNAIYDLFFKISMEHILHPSIHGDEKYVIDLIIGCITYFATVILPSITLVVTASTIVSPIHHRAQKSFTAISFSLGTLLFSLATTVIAVFTAQANLNAPKDLSDNSTMYAYGLKECIIFVFVVFTAIFSLIVATQNNKPLMVGSAIGQAICLHAISIELFTSERISAIVNELHNFGSGSAIEIGIILLNGCGLATVVLLIVQFSVFVSSIVQRADSPHGSTHSLLDNNRNPQIVERTAF